MSRAGETRVLLVNTFSSRQQVAAWILISCRASNPKPISHSGSYSYRKGKLTLCWDPTLLHLISRTVLAGLLHRPNEVGTPLGLAPRSCRGRLRATTRCKLFSGSLRLRPLKVNSGAGLWRTAHHFCNTELSKRRWGTATLSSMATTFVYTMVWLYICTTGTTLLPLCKNHIHQSVQI